MSEALTLNWGTRIPMQDGVSLHGVLYRPQNHDRLATILHITPYGADAWHDRGLSYTQHGYALLLVDSRGRGNSEGVFRPFSPDDGRDGADVVNWITEQSWSDGTVGMIGGSYTGYNQWATLVHRPPGLKSIMPRAAAFPGLDAPRYQNIATLFRLRWLSYVAGKYLNERIFSDDQLWLGRYLDYLDSGLSLRDFAKGIGIELDDADATQFETLTPDDAMYARLDLPILTITSQYDSQQHGALEYYRRHQRARGNAGVNDHYLIVGAWNHATQLRFGGIDLSKTLRFDLVAVELAWFDWIFKHGKRPDFLDARIKVFSTGDNRWHRIRAFDKTTAREEFFLSSQGRLTPRPPVQSSRAVLRSDPRDHRTARRIALKHPRRGLTLTSPDHTNHLFGQGLMYESAPSRRVFTIIGAPQLQLQPRIGSTRYGHPGLPLRRSAERPEAGNL